MYDKKLGLIDKKVSGQYREYFFKGYRIWKRPLFSKVYCRKNDIFSKYDCIYLLNANIGEIYLFLKFYFSKIEKENLLNNKKTLLVTNNPAHLQVAELFSIKNIIYSSCFSADEYSPEFKYRGKEFFVVFNHSHYVETERNIRAHNEHYFRSMSRSLGIAPDLESYNQIGVPSEISQNALDKARKVGIDPNNLIIIIPHANSCTDLGDEVLFAIINKFEKLGYSILVNGENSSGVPKFRKVIFSFEFSITELFSLARRAKHIYAVRCGLAELLADTKQPMTIIYTAFKNRSKDERISEDMALRGFSLQEISPYYSNVKEVTLSEFKKKFCQRLVSKPYFSIIIPIYNAGGYIERCLGSLSKQTFKNFEVICVDDCSTDDSCQIVSTISKKDGRFRLVKHTKNLGPGAARNTGIRTSSGKWITFADADDFYCDNDFLQKAHDLLLNAKCDMLLFDHVEYDESVNEFVCSAHRRFLFNVNDKHLNHVWDEGERNKYLFEIPPFPFTKIISRNAILKNDLFFPEGMFYEDCAFSNIASLVLKNIYAVNWQPYAYCQNVPGQTTQNLVKHINDIIPIHNIVFARMNKLSSADQKLVFARVKFISVALRSLALYFLPQINDYGKAEHFFCEMKKFIKKIEISKSDIRELSKFAPADVQLLKQIESWTPGLLYTWCFALFGVPLLTYNRSFDVAKLSFINKKIEIFKKKEILGYKTKISVFGIPVLIRRNHTFFLFGVIPIGKIYSFAAFTENYSFSLLKLNFLRSKK